MRPIPRIRFMRGEHFAFFFEDTHLVLIQFEREARRLLFLVQRAEGEDMELDFPGELYETKVRDVVDRIFFVELAEDGAEPKRLALGAYFPAGNEHYGAYYDRESDEQTLFFLRILGEGESASLEAVENPLENDLVAREFADRYAGVLHFEK